MESKNLSVRLKCTLQLRASGCDQALIVQGLTTCKICGFLKKTTTCSPSTHTHLPLPGRPPPRSGWSRCCRRPTCTEPPALPGSPSAPGEREERGGEGRGEGRSSEKREGCVSISVNVCVKVSVCVRIKVCVCVYVYMRVCVSTHGGLRGDVGAAHHLGPGQRLLPLGSLPQSHQGRHLWRETHTHTHIRKHSR